MKTLLSNLDKIHTTELGVVRIQRNLGITSDVVRYTKEKVLDPNSEIYKKGKNYYVVNNDEIFTINSYSYTIITAHKK